MKDICEAREKMCAVGKRMYQRQLVSGFEGNLSVRLADQRILCTPSLICKGFLNPDDLCIIDQNGDQVEGIRSRTSEVFLHLAVYEERSDVSAVVHTHAPHATAFAMTGTPIPTGLAAEAEVFLGDVQIAPYATPGTPEFANVARPFMQHSNAILLANHGAVTYGNSLEDAINTMEILDGYCRLILLIGDNKLGSPRRLSDQSISELLDLKKRLDIPDPRISRTNPME